MIDAERLRVCNALLVVIGCHGRRLFHHKVRYAYFKAGKHGVLWYVDKWRGTRLYANRCLFRHGSYKCSEGGTGRRMLSDMSLFIRHKAPAEQVARHFGPWPKWIVGGGDLWGYGDEMERVRITAHALLGINAKQKAQAA